MGLTRFHVDSHQLTSDSVKSVNGVAYIYQGAYVAIKVRDEPGVSGGWIDLVNGCRDQDSGGAGGKVHGDGSKVRIELAL